MESSTPPSLVLPFPSPTRCPYPKSPTSVEPSPYIAKEGSAGVVRDLERGRLAWVAQVVQRHHSHPHKEGGGGSRMPRGV